MTNNSVYVLDANIFIHAARFYYAFDIAPAFWNALVTHAQSGRVITIDQVMKEIERGKDDLAKWIKNTFQTWCKPTTETDVIEAYRDIIKWVSNQNQFYEEAKKEFANVADGWLIAYAKAKGFVVVTHEQLKSEKKNKVQIPNVCNAFNVPYTNTFEMLRRLGVQFR
ncbi:DUF4411 family protein [Thermosediminibacter oceani]|uniref:PilT domain-containing protein n=1 Tax=Thermosediminibacter oceani (strain ATCC BAA-1034 / DSM 16646 / JW/IW-1228P) TaxID=555079 RepID=D9RYZ1_THEOJ|nr:DUF4411 family protein [Thermosediminibacter oceani]ADL08545.1 PilT domain-containing protein [Thermosediminibacter oceani DSM 16646]